MAFAMALPAPTPAPFTAQVRIFPKKLMFIPEEFTVKKPPEGFEPSSASTPEAQPVEGEKTKKKYKRFSGLQWRILLSSFYVQYERLTVREIFERTTGLKSNVPARFYAALAELAQDGILAREKAVAPNGYEAWEYRISGGATPVRVLVPEGVGTWAKAAYVLEQLSPSARTPRPRRGFQWLSHWLPLGRSSIKRLLRELRAAGAIAPRNFQRLELRVPLVGCTSRLMPKLFKGGAMNNSLLKQAMARSATPVGGQEDHSKKAQAAIEAFLKASTTKAIDSYEPEEIAYILLGHFDKLQRYYEGMPVIVSEGLVVNTMATLLFFQATKAGIPFKYADRPAHYMFLAVAALFSNCYNGYKAVANYVFFSGETFANIAGQALLNLNNNAVQTRRCASPDRFCGETVAEVCAYAGYNAH